MEKTYNEAEKAFTDKQYDTAITKIKELLGYIGTNKDAPLEMLYFNIGLANLLNNKTTEAEAGFLECLKRFPKGEYSSRCYLGIGRALMSQASPEKKQLAIKALTEAARDPAQRSQAGLCLGQLYTDLKKPEEALKVFRNLMGADIRSPQQTMAALEVIGVLADTGKLEDLVLYLDYLGYQAGVRDALAWFANQVVVVGDELVNRASEEVGSPWFESALIIYRSIPLRGQILETQKSSLAAMRQTCKLLEARIKAEKKSTINQRSNASELLNTLKPTIEQIEAALDAVEKKTDFDAALLIRRGRCLVYLGRYEEALVCYRTLRTKYADSEEAKAAAYAEIVVLNKLKNTPEIKEKCDLYLTKYPDSELAEKVATLAGEILVQSGDLAEIGSFYRNLETRFPKSENLDRFVFFQGVAFFQAANFIEASPMFDRFLKEFPKSEFKETVLYYVAMSNFLSNKYKETIATCKEYLSKYPDGRYAGDMLYRLAFIDFNDKGDPNDTPEKQAVYKQLMAQKIVTELDAFLTTHPNDPANGSMYCLMADTYRKINELGKAIESYQKAVATDSLDDVMQYALDSATSLLQSKKDWAAIAAMHSEFIKRKPDSQLAILSAIWIARAKAYEGKSADASEMLAEALKNRFADPASEQVESLIDELVKTFVPRKKISLIDIKEIDSKLTEALLKIVAGKESATTNARTYYARARLAQMLKRADLSDLYLQGIATANAKDPSPLSPALLATSGDILLKTGDLDGAETMYLRLANRYKDSLFSDAGPVGLGCVALARNQPEKALKIFDDALENNNGISRFKECTLGKLRALVALDKFDAAHKLGEQIISDKTFRGETVASTYLILAQAYRKQAASAGIAPADAQEFMTKAYGIYQRVYVAYQSIPELCAQAYWGAYETAKELGKETEAAENLKALINHPKLQKTELRKKAESMVK